MRSVLDEAAALVADFAGGDAEAYFNHFAPDATFVFHTAVERLPDRDAYRRLWAQWESEGFRVHACTSSGQQVQDYGEVAVFTHDVETVVSSGGGEPETLQERETIVFRLDGGRWLAVHEHLSPAPVTSEA